jgi:hypothetical protein
MQLFTLAATGLAIASAASIGTAQVPSIETLGSPSSETRNLRHRIGKLIKADRVPNPLGLDDSEVDALLNEEGADSEVDALLNEEGADSEPFKELSMSMNSLSMELGEELLSNLFEISMSMGLGELLQEDMSMGLGEFLEEMSSMSMGLGEFLEEMSSTSMEQKVVE